MKLKNDIIGWLKRQVKEAKKDGVVFGMSGGIDSSVVAVLAKQAFADDCLGLIMPCFSNPKDMDDALRIAKIFNIKTETVQLNSVFSTFAAIFESKLSISDRKSIVLSNIKPRLRMIVLYAFASKLNYLVAGTGNKSEITTGYFTKYGDGAVDLLPIGGLLKVQVLNLARELDIPQVIIDKPPTAGLWNGQTDEGEMGITYAELDQIIPSIEKENYSGLNMKAVNRVKEIVKKSEHKRKPVPKFEICRE